MPFITSVSAFGSTAGFFSFQGKGAVSNAKQYINMFFTNNKSQGLYFANDTGKQMTGEVTTCNYKNDYDLHGFKIDGFCSCNTCEMACDPNDGFQYSDASVF